MGAKQFISLLRETRQSISDEPEGLLDGDAIDEFFIDRPSSYRDFSAQDIKEWREKIGTALAIQLADPERLKFIDPEDIKEELSWGGARNEVDEAIQARHKDILESALVEVTEPEQVEALAEVFPLTDPALFVEMLQFTFDAEAFTSYSVDTIVKWMDNFKLFAVASMKAGSFEG